MLLPLFGAIALVSAAPASHAGDTSLVIGLAASPTVLHTPVIEHRTPLVADSVVVEKAKRTLTLFAAGLPIRSYQVALGTQPSGDKIRQGDGRTPEGIFRIDYKNAQSKYHMALHISYPDAAHIQRADALGVSPGGDIMIHGLPDKFASLGVAHRDYNWTEGCIAVTDEEIEEIWRAVPKGSPVQIKP